MSKYMICTTDYNEMLTFAVNRHILLDHMILVTPDAVHKVYRYRGCNVHGIKVFDTFREALPPLIRSQFFAALRSRFPYVEVK